MLRTHYETKRKKEKEIIKRERKKERNKYAIYHARYVKNERKREQRDQKKKKRTNPIKEEAVKQYEYEHNFKKNKKTLLFGLFIRHLISLRAVTNRIFFLRKDLFFSCVRNMM